MQPKIILSVSHLGQRIGVDRRTVLRRLEKASIVPDFISVSGEWFFSQAAADTLSLSLSEVSEADAIPQEAESL